MWIYSLIHMVFFLSDNSAAKEEYGHPRPEEAPQALINRESWHSGKKKNYNA